MYTSLCAIRSWNWNWKLTQDNFLIEHWIQRTHRCSAVRCWPWRIYSSWLASRDLGTTRSSYLAWVGPVVATNIDCHEPFTLVTTLPKECQSKYDDYKMFTSCTFLFDTVLDYDLNACHFSCICHGHCDVILLRHNFLPWRNNNPEFYKTCDVHIAQQH